MSSWVLLGSDPAPGDPEALRALARAATRTAAAVLTSARELRGLAGDDGAWTGPAAEACRQRIDRLPARLEEAGQALHAAGLAIAGFAEVLDDAQRSARRMLREAELLAGRYDELQAYLRREQLRGQAAALRQEVRAAAGVAARALYRAAEAAPDEPGWFERFVRSNVTWIESASFVLSVAAGVAAVTGVGAPVALGLAAASAAATGLLYHYGEAGEGDVVLAVAGAMMTPVGLGAKALAAGRQAQGVSTRAADVAALASDVVGSGITAYSGVGVAAGVAGNATELRRRQMCRTTVTAPAVAPATPRPPLVGPQPMPEPWPGVVGRDMLLAPGAGSRPIDQFDQPSRFVLAPAQRPAAVSAP